MGFDPSDHLFEGRGKFPYFVTALFRIIDLGVDVLTDLHSAVRKMPQRGVDSMGKGNGDRHEERSKGDRDDDVYHDGAVSGSEYVFVGVTENEFHAVS